MEPEEQAEPVQETAPEAPVRRHSRSRMYLLIGGIVVVAACVLVYLLWRPSHKDEILIPYIAHQKPTIDPHLPSSNSLADKLDEVEFDGLFNLSANPSGVVYEDGLGELLGVDANNVVTVKLKTNKRWHDSYVITADGDNFKINKGRDHQFTSSDLAFTLQRIQSLGSLSPDYILVSQALPTMGFEGPDENNVVRFQFRGDRIWKDSDIKEVLSFKILPANSEMNALNYTVGTAAYMALPPKDGVSNYYKNPDGTAHIDNLLLTPFIDNSTYTTELKNNNINVLLETPFGSLSPILAKGEDFYTKSNVSNTFFALLCNVEKLSRDQRLALRRLINSKTIVDRFFKVNTGQQRHIVDYKGNRDNYQDYINFSIFPSSTYYVEEQIIQHPPDNTPPDLSILPDTVRIQACMNFGFREEYAELIDILNDPGVTHGKVKVTAVPNEELRKGNYDAVLIAVSGYRSNFLFDLYNLFLREPDLQTYKINLVTEPDAKGNPMVSPKSLQASNNFFRLDAMNNPTEQADIRMLLDYVYGFMSTRQIGDKQEYARRIDELEQRMALGTWMFSLPSLAYFSTQFDSTTTNLYGVASQLSTIKKWEEKK